MSESAQTIDERQRTVVGPAPPATEAPTAVTVDPHIGRRLSRATTAMVLLTSLASATNYASSLVFSRLLSPASYGDLTALLAFTVVAAVPTGAAQTVVAERIAVLLSQGQLARARYFIRHASAHVALIAFVLGLLYVACIPLVKSVLGLQAIGPAIALAPLLVLSFFIPTAFGILQGMERFVALGGLMLAVAVLRIAFGVPWTLAGGGAGGALAGQAVGNLLALVATAWIVREYMLGRGTGAASSGLRRRPNRRTLTAGGAFIAFALISNLDVLLAKLLLSAHEAGVYAALATIEKVVIFLPAAIAVVMVPSAAKTRLAEGSAARVLRLAALLVVLTTLLVAIPAVAAPHFVVQTMFGGKYSAAAAGVLPIVCAGAGLALLYLLVVYTVAIQDRRWVWFIGGSVLVQIAAILAFHSSPVEIAIVQATVIGLALIVNELVFHPILRAERLFVSLARSRRDSGEADGRMPTPR